MTDNGRNHCRSKDQDKGLLAGLPLKKCKTVTGFLVECYLVKFWGLDYIFALEKRLRGDS